jgi:pyruvate dehydrogenase E2 component (dihydrolipoamide acetyltransferase)
MPIEIKLPQWGMNMNDGTVIKWLKTVGDKITKDEPLVEIESTKVSSAVEAIEDGILGRINVKEGVLVPVGAVLGLILLEGEKIEDFPETIIEQKVDNKSETQIKKQISSKKILATPRARNLAKKLKIDINLITGTGPSGRITENDVIKFNESKDSEISTSIADTLDVKEKIKSTGIRQIIAKRMYESAQNPQVTLNSKACVDNLISKQKALLPEWRQHRIRPQLNDLIVKIVSNSLEKHTIINSHYINDDLYILENINIGIAMAVEGGLLVPVINNSQDKNELEISKEIREFSKKIKNKQLLPHEISGSTFSITNLTSYNVENFNPIINPPEIAILGLGKIAEEVYINEGIATVRNMIYLSLTFDHRAIDGVPAASFLETLINNIESI